MLKWTWYINNSKGTITSTTNGDELGIASVWLLFVEEALGLAKAAWHLNQNLLDLELGRSFYAGLDLSLRPFIGVRSGWVNRRWHVSYDEPSITPDAGSFSNVPGTFKTKVNHWGVGPRIGLDTTWYLKHGFNFFGDMSACLFYGRAHTHSFVMQQQSSTGVQFGSASVSDEQWRVLTNFQMIIGVGWGTCFNCDKVFFDCKLGWEMLEWMNLANFSTPDEFFAATISSNETISLKGLTFSAKLDF